METSKGQDNKQKIIFVVIGILIGVVIYQGYLLHGKPSEETPPYTHEWGVKKEDSSSLLDRLKKKFQSDSHSTGDIFNEFFNDDFFKQHQDPFKELEEWKKKMSEGFRDDGFGFFNHSWDDWYGEKFGGTGIHASTEEKKDEVVMRFKIPGLKANSLNIDINEQRISLECDIKETREEKDSSGSRVFRSTSHRHISKMLPVPPNVDTAKAKVEPEGEELVITFPKKVS